MRVFDIENGWNSKVNFVDENNVFVGFDTMQDCCEYADWFISDSITEYDSFEGFEHFVEANKPRLLQGYGFDASFFCSLTSGSLDCGEMVVFKLYHENSNPLYLHLFNCHNGYYGHGFEFGRKEPNMTFKKDLI